MSKRRIPDRGYVYWIDPKPTQGREMQGQHRFVVITPRAINGLGVAMAVPITTGGYVTRTSGLAVVIQGHDTTGVAVCNQVRSFDIEERVRLGTARYVETLDVAVMDEIVLRVLSVIDPEVDD